jgi:hypothetical protein
VMSAHDIELATEAVHQSLREIKEYAKEAVPHLVTS